MNPATHHREEALYGQALQLSSPEQREAFLAEACAGNADLLAKVCELLACDAEAEDGQFLPTVISDGGRHADSAAREGEQPGTMIGHYKLREKIGEGGFGSVWVADQEEPVRRRLALKIIKLGMDTKEVIARFGQERQALAMMDHPNIAKVLDAGATEHGRPYFVMELVRGMKITDYCDDQNLSMTERIELFIQVCQAVQHAHQKGIIHRDLKPSNILVTVNDGVAVPKVIDFGVAKATQGSLVEHTIYTKFEQMVGTPLYMSPEQAGMTSLDVDTRSDIYALGVLLYEMLTGRTPIDKATLASAGMDEVRRIIREVDPPRPSARLKTLVDDELTTAAKRRHTEPAKLPAALRGDIDWIVMKCLEKDRKRRYDTANGLALDLQRHLRNEVVIACPPTTAYLLSKLIRRNKLAFAAGTAIAASLVVGIGVSMWQAFRADHESTRARSAEQRAVATLDELRATAPAFVEQARALVTKEQFSDALEKLGYALKLRPESTEILVAKGDLLQSQLRLAEASAAYRAALAINPGDSRAESSAAICDELLAAQSTRNGKLTRENLSKLYLAMQQQQRPAAELMPVARLLGEERTHVLDYWLARLKVLPISDKPLRERLSVREDGLLELNLSNTKIAELSPLAGMPLGSLDLDGCNEITNFEPLQEFRSLVSLQARRTQISDLSPLLGLPLTELSLDEARVFDISVLRGMKLNKLSLRNTRVADLSPLAGMPLALLDATAIPATDYSPLAGAPLEKCIIQSSPLRDLSFLRDSPVKELTLFGCNGLRGYSVLAGLKSLDLLILPQSFRSLPEEDLAAIGTLRSHPTLKNIQTEYREGGGFLINTAQSKNDFWKDWDHEQAFVPALRKTGIQFDLRKLPAGTYRFSILNQPRIDLSVLKGAPISELHIGRSGIADLTPVRDLPLRSLGLWGNPVTDLSPLRGMQIEELTIEQTRVSDVSPLIGLPLKKLYLRGCADLTDVSALVKIPTLEKLTIPMNIQNIEVLRQMPNLQWLGFHNRPSDDNFPATSAEEFWTMWAGLSWMRALNEAGIKYIATQDSGLDQAQKPGKKAGEKIPPTPNFREKWVVTIESKEFSDCSIFKEADIQELILKGTGVSDLRPLEGLDLSRLNISDTPVTDLGPLRAPALSASLERLEFSGIPATDFAALAACTNLTNINASSTALADLAVLQGRRMHTVLLSSSKVTDISALTGMPLEHVALYRTAVTDLSPLLKCPTLRQLTLPAGALNVNTLRALPALTSLSWDDKTGSPTEFWREYEQTGWASALGESGYTVSDLRRLPGDTRMAVKIAALQVWFGRDSQHTSTCLRVIEWAADNDQPNNLERAAKISALRSTDDSAILQAALTLARRAVELGKETRELLPWYQMALGMAEYRNGHHPEAAAALTAAAETASGTNIGSFRDCIEGTSGYYLAMTLFRQGRQDEARTLFTATEATMKPLPANDKDPLAGDNSDANDLILWLACKEAKALLAGPGTEGK
jgi:serine/threonine protein kinase/Leucine-rich repeat (LRR) protein